VISSVGVFGDRQNKNKQKNGKIPGKKSEAVNIKLKPKTRAAEKKPNK